MTHNDLQERIPDLVAGHLNADESRRLQNELSACPECREYFEQVSSFYALDLGDDLQLTPTPMPAVIIKQRTWPILRVAAAAALPFIFLFIWNMETRVDQGNKDTDALDRVATLEIIDVVVPKIPIWTDSVGWIVDANYARELAEYAGKPLVQTYMYSYCPRSIKMKPQFESAEMARVLEGFLSFKTEFDEEFPNALSMRQHEVADTMAIHTPVMIVTYDGVDSNARYDIESVDDVRTYLREWRRSMDSSSRIGLTMSEYDQLRDRIEKLPQLLLKGRWGDALRSLESTIGLQPTRTTRFIEEAQNLHNAIEREINARLDLCRSRLALKKDRTEVANELREMIAALDGHRLGQNVRQLLPID